MEEWRTIQEAIGYEISDQGQVRNKRTGRVLRQTKIGKTPTVTMMDTGFRLTRSVPKLYRDAFGIRLL